MDLSVSETIVETYHTCLDLKNILQPIWVHQNTPGFQSNDVSGNARYSSDYLLGAEGLTESIHVHADVVLAFASRQNVLLPQRYDRIG